MCTERQQQAKLPPISLALRVVRIHPTNRCKHVVLAQTKRPLHHIAGSGDDQPASQPTHQCGSFIKRTLTETSANGKIVGRYSGNRHNVSCKIKLIRQRTGYNRAMRKMDCPKKSMCDTQMTILDGDCPNNNMYSQNFIDHSEWNGYENLIGFYLTKLILRYFKCLCFYVPSIILTSHVR